MKKNSSGLSLIETLVAITVFAMLGVVVTSSLVLTIQGTKKSDAQIRIRENLNYSTSVIERNLRNAAKVNECPLSDTKTINYIDQAGVSAKFVCKGDYIASGSSELRLTSTDISLINCLFICDPGDSSTPPVITIDITARDSSASGNIGVTVTTQTKVYLRNQ